MSQHRDPGEPPAPEPPDYEPGYPPPGPLPGDYLDEGIVIGHQPVRDLQGGPPVIDFDDGDSGEERPPAA